MQPSCPKCSGRMDPGFIIDHNHLVQMQSQWAEGEPEFSKWTGLNLSGKEKRPVTTFCCEKCGYLELYAKPVE